MIKVTTGGGVRLRATLGQDVTGLTVGFVFVPVNPTTADDQGYEIDLTGGTDQLRVATVVDAPGGLVEYVLTGADTALAGQYRAQFQFTTAAGMLQLFPATGWIDFLVEDYAAPASFQALTDFCEPIRAIMGDFTSPYQFEDAALASVVRSAVRMGRAPGYGITGDGQSITPPVIKAYDLAIISYWCARMLLGPQMKSSSWRTRAMSTRDGSQLDFMLELENLIYNMENPTMVSSFQSYYAWVNSLAGINVWGLMTEMKVQSPVATVTIGTGGIQINTT